jgi:PAS domain S-box-containing protein
MQAMDIEVSKNKCAEAELRVSEEKYRQLFENSRDALMIISILSKEFVDVNMAGLKMFGVTSVEEFTKLSIFDILPKVQDGRLSSEIVSEMMDIVMREGSVFFECIHKRIDNTIFPADILFNYIEIGGEAFLQATVRDISERKEAEKNIQQLTKIYKTLSLCNRAIIYTKTPEELFEKICEYSVQVGGMKMAWIGLIDHKTNFIRPVASSGDEKNYLDGIEISTIASDPSGRGPTGTAILEDHPVWCQDFMNDPSTAPWHERGKAVGWRASAALPIHKNGEVVGAFMIYSNHVNVFDTMIQKLIVEMTMNISFALDTFEKEIEKKAAEAELLKMESLLEEMSAMALIGGWDIDAKTGKGTWTKESALICDMKPDKTISIEIFMKIVKEEWQIKLQTAMERVMKKGIPFTMELAIETAKGNEKWIRVICSPIFKNDGVSHVHGSIQDITQYKVIEMELRDSQEKFHNITASAQDAIIMINNDGEISYWNEAAEKIFGYSKKEAMGQILHTLIAPKRFLAAHKNGFSYFKNTGKGRVIGKTLELVGLKKDGSEFPLELSLSSTMINGLWNAIGIVRDITERKDMEMKLREKDELMIAQSRQAAMGDMIAMIAHQWRQPISIIAMDANNIKVDLELEEEIKSEDLDNTLDSITKQTEHLSKTIDDFRNFFKPNQKKIQTTIGAVLDSTIEIIGTSLKNNNITVEIENRSDAF